MNYYYNPNETHRCLECGCLIAQNVYDFSLNEFSIPLCFKDQQRVRYYQQITTHETIRLYFALKERKVNPEIEKFDGYKHIDIAVPYVRLNIEIDGVHHNTNIEQARSDLKRTFHSLKKGYTTIRIPNCLVRDIKTLNETANYLAELIHDLNRKNSF